MKNIYRVDSEILVTLMVGLFWALFTLCATAQIPEQFRLVQGTETVFVSNQPSSDELINIINQYNIEVIVRINPNDGKLYMYEEEYLARQEGVLWKYIPIGQGAEFNYRNLNQIHSILNSGQRVWIHGQYSNPVQAVLAYHWLCLGYTKEQVIEWNRWEVLLKRPHPKFDKYRDLLNKDPNLLSWR